MELRLSVTHFFRFSYPMAKKKVQNVEYWIFNGGFVTFVLCMVEGAKLFFGNVVLGFGPRARIEFPN